MEKEGSIGMKDAEHHKNERFILEDCIFEIEGIEAGVKKASILTLDKREIRDIAKKLKQKGYYCEISDFSCIIGDGKVERSSGDSVKGDYFLYISKDERSCKRLKYLDHYHQFSLAEPKGMTSEEIFFEIGHILGYPRCCSESVISFHKNKDYNKLFEESDKSYGDDTIYRILALRKSPRILYVLNNFRHYSNFLTFFVCRYDCRKASEISERVLEHIKRKYPLDRYNDLIRKLRVPLLFFSILMTVYIEGAAKRGDRICYSKCSYNKKIETDLNKVELRKFKERFNKLYDGDSFSIKKDRILIYKNDKLIHCINKEHKHDGIFIEFN